MPARRRLLVAVVLALVVGAGSRANAGEIDHGFLGDFPVGLAIPLAETNYTRLAEPSFKMGVRVGWQLQLHERFRVAPEIAFHFSPANTDRVAIGSSTLFRVGVLGGGRFIVPLHPRVAVFARFLAGFEHGSYNYTAVILGTNVTAHADSTGFMCEPGLGAEVMIIPHLVAGMTVGVPIALHNYNSAKYTSVDLDLMAFVGYRMDGPISKLIKP